MTQRFTVSLVFEVPDGTYEPIAASRASAGALQEVIGFCGAANLLDYQYTTSEDD